MNENQNIIKSLVTIKTPEGDILRIECECGHLEDIKDTVKLEVGIGWSKYTFYCPKCHEMKEN